MKKLLNNKKYIVVTLLLLCLSVGVTYALYLTQAQQGLTNSFKLQDIDTEIYEDNVVIVDKEIIKAPQVKNKSKNGKAVVRVRLNVSTGSQYKELTIGKGSNDNIKISENWVDGKDGYYYYTKVLDDKEPNNITSPIFEKITGVVYTTDNNSYYEDGYGPFDVTIYQESVQTQIGDIDINKVSDGEFVETAKQLFELYNAK